MAAQFAQVEFPFSSGCRPKFNHLRYWPKATEFGETPQNNYDHYAVKVI